MDVMRADERQLFTTTEEDLEYGFAGVHKAMGILREYNGASFDQQPDALEVHQRSRGTGASVIEILVVIESDFSTSLTEFSVSESESESSYHILTQENKVTKVSNEHDVKFKQEESFLDQRRLS